MVSPAGPAIPEPQDPIEPISEETESAIPSELVQENLPLPEPEKELEDFEVSIVESPSEQESAATDLATEILNIPVPEEPEEEMGLVEEAESIEDEDATEIEDIEGEDLTEAEIEESEEQGLDSAQILESEMEAEEEIPEEAEEEELEEESLDFITEEISDDMLDPHAQEFRKLIDELLPLDDTLNILPREQMEKAAYFFDLEHKAFYTNHPIEKQDLIRFKKTFLILEMTEEEIQKIKIIFIKPKKWKRLLEQLKRL